MTKDSYICSAEIGSVTAAMKAERALSAAAIPCEVIKKESKARGRGCVFGIEFSCAQANNVRTVLGAARINPKNWNDGKPNDIS